MTALTRRSDRVPSLFDSIFGSFPMPSFETPMWTQKVEYTHGISERIEDDTYVAEVTLPNGFDLDAVSAEVQGNILRVRVPRIQAEVKPVEVTKTENTD